VISLGVENHQKLTLRFYRAPIHYCSGAALSANGGAGLHRQTLPTDSFTLAILPQAQRASFKSGPQCAHNFLPHIFQIAIR